MSFLNFLGRYLDITIDIAVECLHHGCSNFHTIVHGVLIVHERYWQNLFFFFFFFFFSLLVFGTVIKINWCDIRVKRVFGNPFLLPLPFSSLFPKYWQNLFLLVITLSLLHIIFLVKTHNFLRKVML
jgi:hypothetical protein